MNGSSLALMSYRSMEWQVQKWIWETHVRAPVIFHKAMLLKLSTVKAIFSKI